VGRDRDQAARSALPASLARGLKVADAGQGRVRVSVRVPMLLPRWPSPIRVQATAGLEAP
jgi:hypothetical protein